MTVLGGGLDLRQPAGHRHRDAGTVERGGLGPGRQVDADRGGRRRHRRPQRVQVTAVRRDVQFGVRSVVGGHPGDLAVGQVDAEDRPPAAVVGREVQRARIGRPGRLLRPPVQAGQQVAARLAGRVRPVDVEYDQGEIRWPAGRDPGFPAAGDVPPVGRDPGAVEVELGAGEQHPAFSAGDIDHHQLAVRLGGGMPLPPAGDQRRAVRCQRERLAVQGPSRFRCQVTKPGGNRCQVGRAGSLRWPGSGSGPFG